ncbi:hypothetical protein BLNAU_14946 [Blattamonas nauphoetae]|uniref:Uncharacterized protein n=1 Tax=Blattamonas nauphoetae TaxID=2049346 RepID=A0ABQ9XFE7_9EUKA|nr:hypothetical protein BLNAU_14946 [Blattamonas nauphoetae]
MRRRRRSARCVWFAVSDSSKLTVVAKKREIDVVESVAFKINKRNTKETSRECPKKADNSIVGGFVVASSEFNQWQIHPSLKFGMQSDFPSVPSNRVADGCPCHQRRVGLICVKPFEVIDSEKNAQKNCVLDLFSSNCHNRSIDRRIVFQK